MTPTDLPMLLREAQAIALEDAALVERQAWVSR